MITFKAVRGYLCPVFVCDWCGEIIQGADQGIIQWNDPKEPIFTALHKGPDRQCSRKWVLAYGLDYIAWNRLDYFVDQLAYNTLHPINLRQALPRRKRASRSRS